ncbi:hypothetical protein Psi02_01580 [Planotetraspora silvatica]|uniref:Uncharacterized protein n=1 Tax=Planotetraspora silvatica TaxID=234614 RepID=A0A8J3UDY3_9ACTN|nr:hypothetical protein [Planotetraspora silvatica]GII43734.1 hypothetical protein Psi02_01580 [Planotetraspora silvatica]
MNGKRFPALLGLALLPAIAFGSAQTAQAATHDPGTSSVADTASDTTIGTAHSGTSRTMSDRMRIPSLDPVAEDSEESEQQEATTPEEISQGQSSTDESLTGEPLQQQSMRGESIPPREEPRNRWSDQSG